MGKVRSSANRHPFERARDDGESVSVHTSGCNGEFLDPFFIVRATVGNIGLELC